MTKRLLYLLTATALVLLACDLGSALAEPTSPSPAATQAADARAPSIQLTEPSPTPTVVVKTQGQIDLALEDLVVTQAVNGEVLIAGKSTIVRAVVALSGRDSYNVLVTVEFGGKNYSTTASVTPPRTTVDVLVDAPATAAAITVRAQVQPQGDVSDPNASNDSKTQTLAVVKPAQKLVAYFLPVDWTPEQIQRYDFQTNFPKFVQDNADYVRGVYPLGAGQLTVDYTLTPHMLTADEKHLANSEGDEDNRSPYLLYAGISLAARRLRPEATLVIGVFPPGWFAKHGRPNLFGLTLREVKGTVTAQYVPGDPTTTAHELGHLFWLYEDYDFVITPPRDYTFIDRPGYWVDKHLAEESTSAQRIPTFLSAYNPDASYWVDTRIYEYLTAKFSAGVNGQASGPLVLAATMAREVEPDNYPSNYAAGMQRFEPRQTVYCAVAVMELKPGQTLEARWFQENQNIKNEKQLTQSASGWYAFSLASDSDLAEGNYHVEIYLDGQLTRTSNFTVKSSR